MKRITLICLFGLLFSQLNGQLLDDFSDGNITSGPVWFGDIEHFLVNENLQLQLNAESGGKSILCSKSRVPDSIRWDMYINLQFATSATNKIRTYLLLDTIDLNNANGYYFEIGQNGPADPMNFFSLENGQSFLLGSSILTFVEDVNFHITIIRDINGNWTFYADAGDGAVMTILKLNDTTFRPEFNNLFCFECYYTATRTDKFVFDEVMVRALEPDTNSPILVEVNATDANNIELRFNENIGSGVSKENIRIEPEIGNPSKIHVLSHKMHVELEKSLLSGETYVCFTQNIPDTAHNTSGPFQKSFDYIHFSSPLQGDIAINEILFDPKSGDSPFIEMYNTSDKYLNCGDIVLTIEKDNSFSKLNGIEECIIYPDSFIVLTNSRSSTISNYPTNEKSALIETDLPAISRKSGSVVLHTHAEIVIDSVYYHKEFHHILLDESRGVSLERINPTTQALKTADWNSASAQSGWGTPGLPNSQFMRLDSVTSVYQLENEVFSPDGDGHEDFLLIRFADAAAGQLATARVYDEFGREVHVLLRNELIGNGSTTKWDGTEHAQNNAPTGIYVLLIELMHETGIVTRYKEPVILAAGF